MLLQILSQEVVDIVHTARMFCLFVFSSSHYSFPLAEFCLTAIFRKSPINFQAQVASNLCWRCMALSDTKPRTLKSTWLYIWLPEPKQLL